MNCIRGNYWEMDGIRAFRSWKYAISVLGVCLVLVFCGVNIYQPQIGIVDIIDNVFWGRMIMLTIPMCTFAYSDALCADCEKKFYRLLYLRGNRKKYLTSKIVMCFAAACAAMTLGFLLFCFGLSFKYPPIISGGDYSYTYMQSYGYLLQAGHYFAYYFLIGFQFGLLAGILATAGMVATAFWTNRLLAYSVPLFLYYAVINLFSSLGEEKPYLQLHLIFKACHSKPWKNDIFCFAWVVLVTLSLLILMRMIISEGMDRRIMND